MDARSLQCGVRRRTHGREMAWAVVALVAALVVLGAIGEARADTLRLSDDPAHLVWGDARGESEDGIRFTAFDETLFVPRSRYVASQPAMDASTGDVSTALSRGGNPDDWCTSADANMQIGNFDEAQRRYRLAYDADPSHPMACSGLLRFALPDLAKAAVKLLEDMEEDAVKGKGTVDWDEILSLFEPYEAAGGTGTLVAQEYWVWTHLALQAELTGRGAARVADSLKRELNKMRVKALKQIVRESDDFEELDAMTAFCTTLYWRPTSFEALSWGKGTDDYARRLRIIEALVEQQLGGGGLWDVVRPLYAAQLEELIDDSIVRDPDDEWVANNRVIQRANAAISENTITDAARAVVVAGNDYREALGINRLRIHGSLVEAAEVHSMRMRKNDHFSHVGVDGSHPSNRATDAGFPPRSLVGENIYFGNDDDDPVATVLAAWLHSPPHHKNMCRPEFTHIGVGSDGVYWTQVFGTPAARPGDGDGDGDD